MTRDRAPKRGAVRYGKRAATGPGGHDHEHRKDRRPAESGDRRGRRRGPDRGQPSPVQGPRVSDHRDTGHRLRRLPHCWRSTVCRSRTGRASSCPSCRSFQWRRGTSASSISPARWGWASCCSRPIPSIPTGPTRTRAWSLSWPRRSSFRRWWPGPRPSASCRTSIPANCPRWEASPHGPPSPAPRPTRPRCAGSAYRC